MTTRVLPAPLRAPAELVAGCGITRPIRFTQKELAISGVSLWGWIGIS